MWLKVSKVDTAPRMVPYRSSLSRSCRSSSSLPERPSCSGLIAHNAEHLLGLVNADHIIARLREHQRQLTGAAAKVGKDAVVDAVLLELCMDVGIQGIVISLAVEFIVEIGKFVVGHGLLRFLFPGHSGIEHRLQLRDAVAVLAAGQHHLLAAIGAAEVLKVFQRLGQLALF